MPRTTRREIASRQKRDLIYKTAIELFQKNGYDQTSMKDISQASGISIGSIYHFYQNKAEILRRYGLSLNNSIRYLIEPNQENIRNARKCIYDYLMNMATCFDRAGYDLVSHLHDNAGAIWIDSEGKFVQESSIQELKPFIEQALKEKTLHSPYSSKQIAEYLHIAGQGIIHTWIILGGKQPMAEMAGPFLEVVFHSLFEENS